MYGKARVSQAEMFPGKFAFDRLAKKKKERKRKNHTGAQSKGKKEKLRQINNCMFLYATTRKPNVKLSNVQIKSTVRVLRRFKNSWHRIRESRNTRKHPVWFAWRACNAKVTSLNNILYSWSLSAGFSPFYPSLNLSLGSKIYEFTSSRSRIKANEYIPFGRVGAWINRVGSSIWTPGYLGKMFLMSFVEQSTRA